MCKMESLDRNWSRSHSDTLHAFINDLMGWKEIIPTHCGQKHFTMKTNKTSSNYGHVIGNTFRTIGIHHIQKKPFNLKSGCYVWV